jgi:hypothetical protein
LHRWQLAATELAQRAVVKVAALLKAGARVDARDQVFSRLAHFEVDHALLIFAVGEWQMRQGTHITKCTPAWQGIAYKTHVWKKPA